MTALEMLAADGVTRRVILRQPGSWAVAEDPRAAAREFSVLQAVRGVGIPAPVPLLLDETGAILPFPYLVVKFVDGEVEHSPTDAQAFVTQTAAELARVHRVDATRPEVRSLPSRSDWLAGARAEKPADVDEALGRAASAALLRGAWPLPHPNPPALLHGDPWPGNMLWHEGRLVAMIDWEEAHIGDPLEDLAIARFDILCMLGPEAMQALTRAYASAQPHIDLTDLAYWDLYAALRPVNNISDWAGGWAALGRPDITAGAMRTLHGHFVARALEQLDSL